MEAIRISCAGFPTRKTFDEFVDRFGLLAPEVLDGRYMIVSFIRCSSQALKILTFSSYTLC